MRRSPTDRSRLRTALACSLTLATGCYNCPSNEEILAETTSWVADNEPVPELDDVRAEFDGETLVLDYWVDGSHYRARFTASR